LQRDLARLQREGPAHHGLLKMLHLGLPHGGLAALRGLAVGTAGGPAALRRGGLRSDRLRLLGEGGGGDRHGGDARKNDTTIHVDLWV
jgi:hypothetical protein